VHPAKIQDCFVEHECLTVPEAGLAGKRNGDLLLLAERQGFEVFLTLDKGIQYQQSLAAKTIAIVIVRTRSNRMIDLLPHAVACLSRIRDIQPGQLILIGV